MKAFFLNLASMFILRYLMSLLGLLVATHFSFAGDAQKIFKKVSPSVVIIYTTDAYDHPQGQGSGVILSSDGKIITNFHVIADAEKIQVHLNKKLIQAKIIGIDPEHDLAVLKIDAKDLVPVHRTAKEIEIGEKVFAIGSPLGYENTISEGIISGRRRSEDTTMELLQITAPFSPGSSGGAVVNEKGALVGISTMNVRGGAQNINFAVPADFIDSVKLKDRISRSELLAISKLREALSIDLRSGDVREAIRLFNEVLRYDLLNETALQQLCYAYLYAGDDSHALEYCNRLAALNPKNQASPYVSASIHFRKGNFEKVKTEARKMIAIKNNWATAHCFYGRSCYMLGQLDSAEVQLKTATSIDSMDNDAHYYLACIYTDRHKLNDALREAQQSIYRNNDCYECNILIGALYSEKKNHYEAIGYYKDAIQIKSNHPLAHMKLAETYFEMKSYNLAAQQARLAVRYDANYCDAYALLLAADVMKPNASAAEYMTDLNDLRNCDPVRAFSFAAFFDSAGVKQGILPGTEFIKHIELAGKFDSLTKQLNRRMDVKQAEKQKTKDNYSRESQSYSGHRESRRSESSTYPASDTLMFGGDYYINCYPLLSFRNSPLLGFRTWVDGLPPDIDVDLYDGSGNKMGSVRNGIVQPGSMRSIKTKYNPGEYTLFVDGQRESTLISMKKKNPAVPGMIEITLSLCLPDGYVLRCTPYEADKRLQIYSGRNIYRNMTGYNLK